MTKLNGWKASGVVLLICAATAIAAQAQTFNILAEFDNSNGNLGYSLLQGPDGNFYGVTTWGGSKGDGTFFRIAPSGKLSSLYSFCSQANCSDGYQPIGGLVLAVDGNFYGTTFGGGTGDPSLCGNLMPGCGTVFRISREGELTTLYSFCSQPNCSDGAHPRGALIQALDGELYGTTTVEGDGANSTGGTVFRTSLDGVLTTLYRFCSKTNCVDGANPEGGLVQASDGNFYGTTTGGGRGPGSLCNGWSGTRSGCGTVFRMTPAGKFNTIHQFLPGSGSTEGADPMVSMIQSSSGSLFGTTSLGGDLSCDNGGYGCGTVFQIDPAGTMTELHLFDWTDGGYPGPFAGLVMGTDGNFYGTTWYGGVSNDGTLFQLSPQGTLTTVHNFDLNDGQVPYVLIQATSGIFYGLTSAGGDLECDEGDGCGTVFSLDMGLNPFVAFVLPAGKVGWTGGILGQGFTRTTSVEINGIPAAFTVVSDTFIKATVPPGATTGYATVTTPSGVLTSNVPFRVIQ